MKTSAQKISAIAIISLMLFANLSCTKDPMFKLDMKMDPLGPSSSIWKVKPCDNDSLNRKNDCKISSSDELK